MCTFKVSKKPNFQNLQFKFPHPRYPSGRQKNIPVYDLVYKSSCMHGCGNINKNRDWLVDLFQVNNLIIGGTIFPHKDFHTENVDITFFSSVNGDVL